MLLTYSVEIYQMHSSDCCFPCLHVVYCCVVFCAPRGSIMVCVWVCQVIACQDPSEDGHKLCSNRAIITSRTLPDSKCAVLNSQFTVFHTHTHTRLTALFPGLPYRTTVFHSAEKFTDKSVIHLSRPKPVSVYLIVIQQ